MDKELESVIALSAELAQVKAERDQARRERDAEAMDAARRYDSSVQYLQGSNLVYLQRAESAECLCRELAVGLTIFGQHRNPCPASYGIVTIKCDCGFEALLSRPEVVKLLEEKS